MTSRPWYRWYVVVVMLVCFAFSFVDRQILALLIAPIKHDLNLSDTRIGLLQGLAFGIFFAIMGLPLGRLVDNSNRRNLVAGGVAVWSVMTALSGAARSFWQLFLPRIGVGVGEATLTPAVVSLVADYFPPESTGLAMSLYSTGIFLGAGSAFVFGGTIVDKLMHMAPVTLPLLGVMAPWRLAFFAIGLPGLLVSLLVFTVKEPPSRLALRDSEGRERKLSLREVWQQILLRWRTTLGLVVTLCTQAMCVYALISWAPAVFQRKFGWTPGHTGRPLGTLLFFCGVTGMFCGGKLTQILHRRHHPEAPLWIAVISSIGVAVSFAIAMSSSTPQAALAWLGPDAFFLGIAPGPLLASIGLIYPANVRGQVTALFSFLNVTAIVLGPLVPALLNNYLFHDEYKLNISVAITTVAASTIMCIAALLTVRRFRADYDLLHGETAA
jgi:MFS family permease